MEIKNKQLERFLKLAAGKFGIDERLTEEDIRKINELNISKVSPIGEDYKIDLSEMPELPNLAILSLRNFEIKEEDAKKINGYTNLSGISFVACSFVDENTELNPKALRSLSLLYCQNTGNLKYSAPETLRVVCAEPVDLSRIAGIDNVSRLDLHLSRVSGFNALMNSSKLEELILDGSEYTDEEKETINKLKAARPNIKVSQKEDYEPTM